MNRELKKQLNGRGKIVRSTFIHSIKIQKGMKRKLDMEKAKLKIEKKDKYVWLAILLIACSAFYSVYVFSIIPPQTGWWQYMAQRLSEGKLLYRDVFMYVPPYFTWLTTALYSLFHTNFALYTCFGLVFFRLFSALLSYLLMQRYTSPQVAAVAVLTGACLTSSYLMDQAYDYNPLIMTLTLLQTYLLVRTYESKKKKTFYSLTVIQGCLCGIQFMLKQNTGIILPICFLICLVCVSIDREKEMCKWTIAMVFTGIIVGIAPACIWLTLTGTWEDFIWCITTALDAKVGGGGACLKSHSEISAM